MDQLNKSTNFAKFDFMIKINEAIKNAEQQDPKPTLPIEEKQEKEVKKVATKCSVCKKKLILAGTFDCACDEHKRYCPTHRFPEEHACTKGKSKVELIKVVADKLEKI
jgi:hypothetical protein